MANMLRKAYHLKGNCQFGCCPMDSRSRDKQRRSARRREKQEFRKSL